MGLLHNVSQQPVSSAWPMGITQCVVANSSHVTESCNGVDHDKQSVFLLRIRIPQIKKIIISKQDTTACDECLSCNGITEPNA